MIAEVYASIERLVRYYGEDGRGAQLPFNMHLISTPWDAEAIARAGRALRGRAAGGRVAELGARQPRPPADRQPRRAAQARVAAMLLLTLRGTPTLYYGDELGMEDVPIAPERVVDPGAWRATRAHADAVGPGARRLHARPSRGCRTATWRSTSPPSATTRARCSACTGALLALRREFAEERLRDAPRRRRRARLRARRAHRGRAQPDRRAAAAAGRRRGRAEHAPRRRRRRRALRADEGVVLRI